MWPFSKWRVPKSTEHPWEYKDCVDEYVLQPVPRINVLIGLDGAEITVGYGIYSRGTRVRLYREQVRELVRILCRHFPQETCNADLLNKFDGPPLSPPPRGICGDEK